MVEKTKGGSGFGSLKTMNNPYSLMKRSILQKTITWTMTYISWPYKLLTDKAYIKLKYWAVFGKKLDLENPRSFNEKIQWLKLHDHNPLYTKLVDKAAVKEYVASIIGNKYIIPTLGVWDSFDEIDFDSLPNKFVLKCTHDSGGIVICKGKDKFNIAEAKKTISKCLKRNYYWSGREWPYKDVKPRIIAEQYLVDESGKELKDYKVFNFEGVPVFVQVDYDRFTSHKRNLYSLDWKYINAEIEFPTDPQHEICKPSNMDDMIETAKKLSFGFPHVRTDFYIVNGRLYFGELTFYHGSGFEEFRPDEFGDALGNRITLSNN